MVSFCEYKNGVIPFRNRLFLEKIGNDVKIIDVLALIEDEEKFLKVSDEDEIRLCLLLSLEVIFMGRELVSVVDDVLLIMVDNLDAWNTFPWDEHIWRKLYDSIKNVSSKHKLEHLDGLRKNPNHVPSYSLSGFLFCFQESSCESDCWWTKVPELISRAVAWTRKVEFFKSPPVSNGGLYGEYLIKRSAARVVKQKDNREFHPGLRGRQKGREAALIDRVHDLEGLCESLLTLPKEVKSLRGRIFKLESIIQMMIPKTNCVEKEETVLNGFCNLSQSEDEKGDCEIIRLAYQRQHDDISKMAEETEQKMKFEIQRLYDHREARLNKIVEEEKERQFIGQMNSSAHMKLAIERCVPKKEEDLKRPFNRIDRIFLSHNLEEWLSRSVVGHCKFPWCNDISVDRSFWHGLCGLDDNRQGWLVDEVFILINEPKRHWPLLMFYICSGIVTFYDSEKSNATHDKEFRPWYLKMRQCLEDKILVVLKETRIFEKKIIDLAKCVSTRYEVSVLGGRASVRGSSPRWQTRQYEVLFRWRLDQSEHDTWHWRVSVRGTVAVSPR
ncbi:phospholipase-like protein [Tanacetum coccineum]|uniref:Phospholipase-like protein n=1 Tax=Tanacetum coccineum TaxID=301880 RepID=A0ABQ5DJ06_9ASTR